jgi:diguanylate cyclase (GGDEF)-like protein
MRKHKGFKLRTILSLLVIGSVLLTAIFSAYLALQGSVRSLSSNYLENNYSYANKLAFNTNDLLNVMQNNIENIAEIAGDDSFTQKQLDIMFKSNEQYFNSILIANSDRNIKFLSPGNTGIEIGALLTSDASIHAATYGKTMISKPYIGVTERLIILISSPIYNDKGVYIGFVGGTLYLNDDNALSRLLGDHYYQNGSYVYVVDSQGRILYHPQKDRINEIVTTNEVINNVIVGINGSSEVTNSKGDTFFAGYAYEPISGWGVVSQTPTFVLDEPKWELIWNMLFKEIPMSLLILIIALLVSRYISTPLNTLVKFSEDALDSKKANPPSLPKVNSFIYDVNQLHKSMDKYLELLNEEIKMDSLTGLSNRKMFDITIQEWFDEQISFSLILIDLDYFKRINDEYGHKRGDEVLQYVASQLRNIASEDDLCFRYGGEEFGILVKNGEKQLAIDMAERLHKQLSVQENLIGLDVTLSVGITFSDNEVESPQKLFEMADEALYQSKNDGRNRTTIYSNRKKVE